MEEEFESNPERVIAKGYGKSEESVLIAFDFIWEVLLSHKNFVALLDLLLG